jgi:hypothetical protein
MAVVVDRPLPPVGTISLPEAARRLGVHRTVVNKYVLRATLPAVNVLGRWYVRPEDVEKISAWAKPRVIHRGLNPSCYRLAATLADWGGGAPVELAADNGLHDGHVRRLLIQMQLQHLVAKEDDGTWRLTDHGREWLSTTPPPVELPKEVRRGKSRP